MSDTPPYYTRKIITHWDKCFCPSCLKDVSPDDSEFDDDFYDQTSSINLYCPRCNSELEITWNEEFVVSTPQIICKV